MLMKELLTLWIPDWRDMKQLLSGSSPLPKALFIKALFALILVVLAFAGTVTSLAVGYYYARVYADIRWQTQVGLVVSLLAALFGFALTFFNAMHGLHLWMEKEKSHTPTSWWELQTHVELELMQMHRENPHTLVQGTTFTPLSLILEIQACNKDGCDFIEDRVKKMCKIGTLRPDDAATILRQRPSISL